MSISVASLVCMGGNCSVDQRSTDISRLFRMRLIYKNDGAYSVYQPSFAILPEGLRTRLAIHNINCITSECKILFEASLSKHLCVHFLVLAIIQWLLFLLLSHQLSQRFALDSQTAHAGDIEHKKLLTRADVCGRCTL